MCPTIVQRGVGQSSSTLRKRTNGTHLVAVAAANGGPVIGFWGSILFDSTVQLSQCLDFAVVV